MLTKKMSEKKFQSLVRKSDNAYKDYWKKKDAEASRKMQERQIKKEDN